MTSRAMIHVAAHIGQSPAPNGPVAALQISERQCESLADWARIHEGVGARIGW
jgi:hypothetical protein